MAMASRQTVNAVLRTIDLLQAMNRQPVSSVHWLHEETGIPKPSIIRLLKTLATKKIVRHAPQHGAYMLTEEALSLCAGFHGIPRIIHAGADALDAYTRQAQWPIALATYDCDAMVVRYSTIPLSPLSLLHSSINMRLSLVSRAIGKAYLASCSPARQVAILDSLAASKDPEDLPATGFNAFKTELATIAAEGFAMRVGGIRPQSSTLAVPIRESGEVVATIGTTWISSAMKPQEAVRRYLPLLRQTATLIQDRVATTPSILDFPRGEK